MKLLAKHPLSARCAGDDRFDELASLRTITDLMRYISEFHQADRSARRSTPGSICDTFEKFTLWVPSQARFCQCCCPTVFLCGRWLVGVQFFPQIRLKIDRYNGE